MDINAVSQLIGSLGFPIVACAAMFYILVVQTKQHKEEVMKMSEALNNNTLALTELKDSIRQSNSK